VVIADWLLIPWGPAGGITRTDGMSGAITQPRALGLLTGRPLFGPLAYDVELTLMRSRAYEFWFVQSTYRIDVAD
jgi:hypothetical protein